MRGKANKNGVWVEELFLNLVICLSHDLASLLDELLLLADSQPTRRFCSPFPALDIVLYCIFHVFFPRDRSLMFFVANLMMDDEHFSRLITVLGMRDMLIGTCIRTLDCHSKLNAMLHLKTPFLFRLCT